MSRSTVELTLQVQDMMKLPLSTRIQHAFWDATLVAEHQKEFGFSDEEVATKVAESQELLTIHLDKLRELESMSA